MSWRLGLLLGDLLGGGRGWVRVGRESMFSGLCWLMIGVVSSCLVPLAENWQGSAVLLTRCNEQPATSKASR